MALTTLTVRIPLDIADRLRLAAVERRIRREEPATAQAIAAAALDAWLRAHGH